MNVRRKKREKILQSTKAKKHAAGLSFCKSTKKKQGPLSGAELKHKSSRRTDQPVSMNKDNVPEQLSVHRHLTPRQILLSLPTYVFLNCACEKLPLEGDPAPKLSLVTPE